MTSSPAPATMTSLPGVPTMRSSPGVPTMVACLEEHVAAAASATPLPRNARPTTRTSDDARNESFLVTCDTCRDTSRVKLPTEPAPRVRQVSECEVDLEE